MKRIISTILAVSMILTAVASMTGCSERDVTSLVESSNTEENFPKVKLNYGSEYETYINETIIPEIGVAFFNTEITVSSSKVLNESFSQKNRSNSLFGE